MQTQRTVVVDGTRRRMRRKRRQFNDLSDTNKKIVRNLVRENFNGHFGHTEVNCGIIDGWEFHIMVEYHEGGHQLVTERSTDRVITTTLGLEIV